MIAESRNAAGHVVVSSDHWHVLHARWERNLTEAAHFTRTVVSEHASSASARVAAREFMLGLVLDLVERPLHLRDQVFVRKPRHESLKRAQRLNRKSR